MKNSILILLLFIAGCTTVSAQDIDSTGNRHDAIVEHQALFNDVQQISWCNPAMMESAYSHSLTHFYLASDWQKKSAPFILQKGTGHFLASVKADSYIRLGGNTAVWGKASYTTGKNHDIKWNSISDYDLLEPDILGDTIEGNTRSEKYVFEGTTLANRDTPSLERSSMVSPSAPIMTHKTNLSFL